MTLSSALAEPKYPRGLLWSTPTRQLPTALSNLMHRLALPPGRARKTMPRPRKPDRTLADQITNSIYPLQRRRHPPMTAPVTTFRDLGKKRAVLHKAHTHSHLKYLLHEFSLSYPTILPMEGRRNGRSNISAARNFQRHRGQSSPHPPAIAIRQRPAWQLPLEPALQIHCGPGSAPQATSADHP